VGRFYRAGSRSREHDLTVGDSLRLWSGSVYELQWLKLRLGLHCKIVRMGLQELRRGSLADNQNGVVHVLHGVACEYFDGVLLWRSVL
jgi:hypothetical protein